MKIYCYYTFSYKILVKEWFLPSIREGYEVVLKEDSGSKTQYATYKDDDWPLILQGKVGFIIEAIKDNWDKEFIFSDPDVRFVGETKKEIENVIRGNDLVFQKNNSSKEELCAGFFICRGNSKTLRFWSDVRKARDDQDCANDYLVGSLARRISLFIRNKKAAVRFAVKLSQMGLNRYRIKWRFLSDRFFNPGILSGKIWEPGMPLEIPDDIVLHHANWCVGVENKIAQFKYVKDIVDSKRGK